MYANDTSSSDLNSLDSSSDSTNESKIGNPDIVPRTYTQVDLEKNDNNNNSSDSRRITHIEYERVPMFRRFLGQFDPYLFIFVMGVGISSDLLYSFPYPAHWLRICSFIMFAMASILFISLQVLFLLHFVYFTRSYSKRQYFNKYFRNLSKNIFWGTYPMGLVTIINYLNNLANYFNDNGCSIISRNLMRLVYILWWYDIIISVFIAWGVTFIIWQNYYFYDGLGQWNRPYEKMAADHLKSVLLLAIIPMIVGTACSSIFTLSELFTLTFNRNIQLLTMVITALIWLHAIIFVFIILFLYFWSLYVFKIPPMSQVFTMFLVLGPMGQGSFGILLLTNNIKLYVDQYYQPLEDNTEYNILLISVPWCFKIIGLITSVGLLSMGYFFTIISLIAIVSYSRRKECKNKPTSSSAAAATAKRVYQFHQGFWGATFPMGTMSLGSYELWVQFNEYVPLGAFRIISTIYAVVCVLWTLYCLINTIILYSKRGYHAYKSRNALLPVKKDEMTLDHIVSRVNPETDFSFMEENDNTSETSSSGEESKLKL